MNIDYRYGYGCRNKDCGRDVYIDLDTDVGYGHKHKWCYKNLGLGNYIKFFPFSFLLRLPNTFGVSSFVRVSDRQINGQL